MASLQKGRQATSEQICMIHSTQVCRWKGSVAQFGNNFTTASDDDDDDVHHFTVLTSMLILHITIFHVIVIYLKPNLYHFALRADHEYTRIYN